MTAICELFDALRELEHALSTGDVLAASAVLAHANQLLATLADEGAQLPAEALDAVDRCAERTERLLARAERMASTRAMVH